MIAYVSFTACAKRKYLDADVDGGILQQVFFDMSIIRDKHGKEIVANAKMRAKCKEFEVRAKDLPRIEEVIMKTNLMADRPVTFGVPKGTPSVCGDDSAVLFDNCYLHNRHQHSYLAAVDLSAELIQTLQRKRDVELVHPVNIFDARGFYPALYL